MNAKRKAAKLERTPSKADTVVVIFPARTASLLAGLAKATGDAMLALARDETRNVWERGAYAEMAEDYYAAIIAIHASAKALNNARSEVAAEGQRPPEGDPAPREGEGA